MSVPFRYDPEADAEYRQLRDAPVDHTVDPEPPPFSPGETPDDHGVSIGTADTTSA